MLYKRVIPCLLLQNQCLVKTISYKKPKYIGDALNTVRIFNELEVDELIFLDFRASLNKSNPNYELLKNIASECFMPLAYGGGIRSLDQAKKIIEIGYEKIIINSAIYRNKSLITQISNELGSQSVICAIDVKKNIFGKYSSYSNSGKKKENNDPFKWAEELESLGAGEIMITSINNEGTWSGFDLELNKRILERVNVPIIGHGGAGSLEHINKLFDLGASAAAIGSMVVYQKKGMGVLINYPKIE